MRSEGSPLEIDEAGERLCGFLAEEMGYTINQLFLTFPG
jgi:hypothetical protein